MAAIHPMSIIAPGNAINVTCISHLDEVEFGLTIGPRVLSDSWLLVDGLEEALAELRRHVGSAASDG